jgi:hypothetical protein
MQFDQIKRREFITLLGCAAAPWPGAARAQATQSTPKIVFLAPGPQSYQAEFIRGFVI